jgi:hypothetical protein
LREESLQEKASPLPRRKKHTREGLGAVPEDKTIRHVASGSHGEISCHLIGTHSGIPLRRT